MAQNKFVEQITAFFTKLTTTQKVVLGVSVVAAVAGLSMLIFQTSKPTMGVLFSELEQKDAAVIVDKLKEQNIPYELSNNGSTVMVASDKVYETRLAMAKDGFMPNNTVGYELFDKTNLGMSDFVQKLNYKRAIEGELQKTISSFDECQKVRVMIVMPERTLFEKDQKKATAAVHLHLKNGRSISKLNVEGIQNLVASSIEGMAPQDVTVVDQRGQILSEA
ncbi:MAG: flagellar basal-body MS-ring/collar protein FliF, partial [Candidatus Kapaibacterium sp.]